MEAETIADAKIEEGEKEDVESINEGLGERCIIRSLPSIYVWTEQLICSGGRS